MSNKPHQREMAQALETQPPIFKLNVDCFEELFFWLSLKDLHSFGQTCKRMQQVAGYYYRFAYSGATVYNLSDGIYCNSVKINIFSDLIENLLFQSNNLECFHFAKSNEFKSLKYTYFDSIRFDNERVECIKKFLDKVEIVEMYRCSFSADFYDGFLRHCTNLKRLRVQDCEVGHNWLLQNYPNLGQLVLNPLDGHQTDDLTTFLTRNSSLQHFATHQSFLWANRHSFLAANVKLDTLSILYKTAGNNGFRDMINEFKEREVYKRLHLYIHGKDLPDAVHQFVPTSNVEKLVFDELPMNVTSLSSFVNLKELQSIFIPRTLDMDLVARSVVNVELVHFWDAYPNQIFAFIRHSKKLNQIAIGIIHELEGNILDVGHWNEEREKLTGARKVTVYVDEKVFLATEEATQNKEYRLIEVKRIDSYGWTSDFPYF